MKKPVLLVTFNRKECLKEVFKAISEYKPEKFYIASDGPREGVLGEKEITDSIREWLLSDIHWDCEVKTRFLEKNSGGCGIGVSSAVTWFFQNEKEGIILEDDCVPNQSFFHYCEKLLDKYRDNKNIWHITGDAPIDTNLEESYYFSNIEFCWGWASWADRWQYFNMDLSKYDKKNINMISPNYSVRKYWCDILDTLNAGMVDSWDYQWVLNIIEHKGLTIIPSKPLVSNIGVDGIHYTNSNSGFLNKKLSEIQELKHPQKIEVNKVLQERIFKERYGITFLYPFRQILKQIFSITNLYINSKKYKLITIFGLKIKILKDKKIWG